MDPTKVLVIMSRPDQAGLLYCKLSDLTFEPLAGRCYSLKGKIYEVARTVEQLDRHDNGTRLSTSEQIEQLLGSLSDLANMQNIGEPDVVVKIRGLIVSKTQHLLPESDAVVLVELKEVSSRRQPIKALGIRVNQLVMAPPDLGEPLISPIFT